MVLCNWRLCLVLEAARIILCVCLVLSSLQTRGTSWKSLPFQNLFTDGEEKMFFLFPKGWSWAGYKKGTTFLGSQDRDDPILENNFLLCKKCRNSVPKLPKSETFPKIQFFTSKFWIFSKIFIKNCHRKLSSKTVIENCHRKLSSKFVMENCHRKLSSKIVIKHCYQKLSSKLSLMSQG